MQLPPRRRKPQPLADGCSPLSIVAKHKQTIVCNTTAKLTHLVVGSSQHTINVLQFHMRHSIAEVRLIILNYTKQQKGKATQGKDT